MNEGWMSRSKMHNGGGVEGVYPTSSCCGYFIYIKIFFPLDEIQIELIIYTS